MKTKFLFFLMCFLLLQVSMPSLAREMKSARQIELRTRTKAQHRSITIPPAAFIEGSLLTVDLLSPTPTVTTIVKDAEGNIVYSSTELDVEKINIDLTGQEKGKYTLEMQLPTETFTGEFDLEE